MDPAEVTPSSGQLGKITDRLNLYRNQLLQSSSPSTEPPSNNHNTTPSPLQTPATMSRDPITCHVLNTLTGTPAANLPVTLTLLSGPSTSQDPLTFRATTDADGRVKTWDPTSASSQSVPGILAGLPAADSKTNWSVRFDVGPWYEAQGVESFWPEVEVKFTVKGRGRDGEEGWRHYHVPVLLGPWNYSTYRGS
ncbi:hydroxyisourate hydrolase [Aspergillus ibericus CBS 121593]|uniref:hydroxyisourate hydrolase n=1 Tax=Aspergillus ibericus CBS 121593 TaxID=1448316 RepID=A0A395H1C6_9EURO|nr:transthyretin domain protein [Aspergillus ibericus CBS 121593]RAL01672.1 transthyretin domain protein [Aspergillus ibericus CBS 121593]